MASWLTGQLLKAAVSRQREYLADAGAVQWTRSQDGLGGVLRKVQTQSALAAQGLDVRHTGIDHPNVQHMLLMEADLTGGLVYFLSARFADRLHSHPTLEDRVRRVYGYPMPSLPSPPSTSRPSGPTERLFKRWWRARPRWPR